MAELISSYGVSMRRSGSNWMACCPFHNEKTPSFSINSSKGLYHCFGCGESGDAVKFVMKQEGLDFAEAVKKLAARCGIEVETEQVDKDALLRKRLYALTAALAQFYRRCLLKTSEAAFAREYLARRGLDESVQEEFLIGYAPSGASVIYKWAEKYGYTADELDAAGVVAKPRRAGEAGYHRFGGRLMFTIFDRQGRAVAFSGRQLVENKRSGKYVNSSETPIFKKSQVLYAFDKAAPFIAKSSHREVICCEGQIDAIRLHMAGFRTAVASQGTAFTREHAGMINRVADAAVLMYDDDAAGHKAAVKTASMLLSMGMPVRVAALPDGDDPDSFLRKHTAGDMQRLIDDAQSIVSFQCRIERAKERSPDSIDAVARVSRAVVRTIAHCPSPVLRASMGAEAAKLLALGVGAVADEVELAVPSIAKDLQEAEGREGARARGRLEPLDAGGSRMPRPVFATFADFARDGQEAAGRLGDEVAGQDAARAVAPSSLEMAFMAWLFSQPTDGGCAAAVREYIPPAVFGHDFTVQFVAAWLGGACEAFAQGLSGDRREWFDRVFLDSAGAGQSTLAPETILHDFIRRLWCDALRRRRGGMPAAGGPDASSFAADRMSITIALKRLEQCAPPQMLETVGSLLKQQEIMQGRKQWT